MASAAVGDDVAGHHIVAVLGESSSGRRYVADPPARLGLQGAVVLKVMDAASGRAFERFVRELTLVAQVDSPHVVQLYEAGQEPGMFWVSMEHCPLGSLADPSAGTRRERLLAVADAARAVHALHEIGVAHRDVRPATVLLTPTGGKLADVSLARHVEADASVMADMAYVDYVDPALIRGAPAGRATDVYSLGAVLHYVLTGRSLYPHLDDVDPMTAVRTVLRDGPLVDDSLSDHESDLVMSMVSADAAGRPSDAAAVAAAIDAIATT
jgi:eukaryotic-like serine/threonine-protein kinase